MSMSTCTISQMTVLSAERELVRLDREMWWHPDFDGQPDPQNADRVGDVEAHRDAAGLPVEVWVQGSARLAHASQDARGVA
jgi:hypothetical protein